MSKTVKFGMLGKEITLIDSNTNVTKVSNGVQKILSDVNTLEEKLEAEKKPLYWTYYGDVIRPDVIDGVADLVGLTATEKKKLQDESYSDIEEFYGEACKKFIGMDLPGLSWYQQMNNAALAIDDGEEAGEPEDPKLPEDE